MGGVGEHVKASQVELGSDGSLTLMLEREETCPGAIYGDSNMYRRQLDINSDIYSYFNIPYFAICFPVSRCSSLA